MILIFIDFVIAKCHKANDFRYVPSTRDFFKMDRKAQAKK